MKRTIPEGNEEGSSFELPVENELLMLKLKAEFGAECTTGNEQIPPAVVNEFLKSVYEFEQKFREPRGTIKIYDKVGRPPFHPANELAEKQLSRELKRLIRHMQHHRIELDILGQYTDRVIYTFLTTEFFAHEMEDLDMPGYVHHFCYEDFHPNHEMDIRNRATEFITGWFNRKINEYSWELADPLIHPDTREFSKEEVIRKINNVFSAYASFRRCEYRFEEVSFEWSEERGIGRGYAGGVARYEAVIDGGESVLHEGPFQFYLSNGGNWWSIFYFLFPGFRWQH